MLNKFICKLQYKLSLNFMLKQKILMKIVDSKKKATKTKCDYKFLSLKYIRNSMLCTRLVQFSSNN